MEKGFDAGDVCMNVETQIVLAILGSGLLSTFIVVLNDWIKSIYEIKKSTQKELYRIREDIHKEFLKNIDFIYKAEYITSEEQQRKRHNFLKTYRMLFLYAQDEEVLKINNMLDSIVDYPVADTNEIKEKKFKIADSFLIFRKHIVKDTKLTKEDYRHIV